MNTDTGQIIEVLPANMPDLMELAKQDRLREMVMPLTARQAKERLVRANDICPCGSGQKFKKCCYTGEKGRVTVLGQGEMNGRR